MDCVYMVLRPEQDICMMPHALLMCQLTVSLAMATRTHLHMIPYRSSTWISVEAWQFHFPPREGPERVYGKNPKETIISGNGRL